MNVVTSAHIQILLFLAVAAEKGKVHYFKKILSFRCVETTWFIQSLF